MLTNYTNKGNTKIDQILQQPESWENRNDPDMMDWIRIYRIKPQIFIHSITVAVHRMEKNIYSFILHDVIIFLRLGIVWGEVYPRSSGGCGGGGRGVHGGRFDGGEFHGDWGGAEIR